MKQKLQDSGRIARREGDNLKKNVWYSGGKKKHRPSETMMDRLNCNYI